jgi:hypothetical protein
MAEARFTSLSQLKQLFDLGSVRQGKIETIKLLRQITGEGLRETKDFYEQELLPFLQNGRMMSGTLASDDPNHLDMGDPPLVQGEAETRGDLDPPTFLIGHSYQQYNGEVVLIVGAANQNTDYETVYSIGPDGRAIHRYNRRDRGRVTGSSMQDPSPMNLKIP